MPPLLTLSLSLSFSVSQQQVQRLQEMKQRRDPSAVAQSLAALTAAAKGYSLMNEWIYGYMDGTLSIAIHHVITQLLFIIFLLHTLHFSLHEYVYMSE